ncbi:RnfH family protein [Massilia sp. TS11]|uniref:RnfH family protein n=1 Tax=Massilia sp. TS11 TaxID=2908003 RepID=UPI001EDACBFD|nr:RnfH family protein [Massilia sp. TS11]MCG2584113.1 RnfH family protein [Massilia sp. TS11]
MADMLQIQVAYATAEREFFKDLAVPAGTTIGQAIIASGIAADVPGIDLDHNPVGVFGKKKTLDTLVRAQDRIEIYRPLIADPKEARRRRAARKPKA